MGRGEAAICLAYFEQKKVVEPIKKLLCCTTTTQGLHLKGIVLLLKQIITVFSEFLRL